MRYASKQISQANRTRHIKKTVTKKSFAGVSVNQRDKNGLNVLAKAAELVINKQLVNAASNRNISEVENLLDRGADVNATDPFQNKISFRYGRTALHWAAIRGPLEFVKLLLDRGADVNATDRYGKTALHEVVMLGDWAIVKVLVIAGANVDAATGEGVTPLEIAALWGFTDIVKVLVRAGANVGTKNNRGETAVQRATTSGHYVKVNNAIEEGKTELIAQLGALEKEHIEKSVELIDSLRKSLFKTSNTNNQDFLNKLLDNNTGKRKLGLCFLEPKLRLEKARQYSAEAASTLQAMARGNQGRK